MTHSNKLLQVMATMVKGSSMAHRTIRLTFDTNELNEEQIGKVMQWIEKDGWLSFSVAMVKPEDVLNLPEVKSDERKSPSQRLRACLFIWWEQRGKVGDFDVFYRDQLEKIINSVKEKLV